MIDSAERLGLASRTLRLWANLYRRGAFRAPLPSGSWQAVDDLIRIAKQADRSAGGALAESLASSNRTFDPLADPLAIEFRDHRWLSSEREEAYSDWLGWILEQIGDAGRILRLLGVRDSKLHVEQIQAYDIKWIDMVVVNLQPLSELISRPGVSADEVIDQVDIGGVAMLRSAAKNHRYVTPVVNPQRYPQVMHELRAHEGSVSYATRFRLAQEAFCATAEYDAALAQYLMSVAPAEE